MSNRRQHLGRRGEALARRHLEAGGYKVVETNRRTPSGEIDIVAEHEGFLVFVEVRTRSSKALGLPEESVTPRKRARLVDCAHEYLEPVGAIDAEWRIDVAAVEVDSRGVPVRMEIITNAVEL